MGMNGKGKRRDIAKLNMDYLFEGGSESELKRKRVENFPGKTISSCSRHKCDHQLWELRNGTGKRTLHFPWPPNLQLIFVLSRFLRKLLSLCHGDELALQTSTAPNTIIVELSDVLNQSLVKPNQEKSHPKRANWNEPSCGGRSNFPALGRVWYSFF